MSRGTAIARLVRLTSVLALGAFGVHQLRYLAAHGHEASERLAHEGHGYLGTLLPLLAALALAALAATVLAARFGGGGPDRRTGSGVLGYGLALLAIYGGQELIEGALSAGHPDGLAALVANGGWLALPLAFVLGAIAAALVRTLEGVEAALAAHPRQPRLPTAPRSHGARRSLARLRPALRPLAFGLARRPPPPALAPSH